MDAEHRQSLAQIADIARRHSEPGVQDTLVPRLRLFRADEPSVPTPNVYDPMYCLVVAGSKRGYLGGETVEYRTGDSLLVTVDLPVVGQILEAAPERPYLAMSLMLDRPTLAAVLLECEAAARGGDERCGFRVGRASLDVVDAALRLVRLLDRPEDIAVLAPLIERELLYRLLTSPAGVALREIARGDSRVAQVTRAVTWLRDHHASEYNANELAQRAHMSVSSLNRHFRAMTGMSPLEFQKHVRLLEARRLLLVSATDVGGVGRAVGYGSVSQFSREYRRLFGEPPGRDAQQLRRSLPAD
ncbi:MAG: AraC family transcriptional regulator N-terminal domain-containing protein [Planctomycetota bacterium]